MTAQAPEPQASSPPAPASRRRLFDLINVPLLALVALMFFLPQCKLSCGEDIHAKFSGPNLALGTDPAIEGLPQGSRTDTSKRDYSLDPLFLLVPIGAIVGAVLFYLASQRPLEEGRRFKLWQIPAALLILFLFYSMAGFGVERAVDRELKKDKPPGGMQVEAPIVVGKTGWYYAEFIFVAVALGLALKRRSSPAILLGPGRMQIVPDVPSPGSGPPVA